jgi:hypothetical protein
VIQVTHGFPGLSKKMDLETCLSMLEGKLTRFEWSGEIEGYLDHSPISLSLEESELGHRKKINEDYAKFIEGMYYMMLSKAYDILLKYGNFNRG